MTELSERLKACATMVSGKGIACDVGTDHAYLPIHLVKSGICSKALACDINKGPLEYAWKNIAVEGLGEQISTILTDGLSGVNPDGISDIIIAGMGAETIIHIIDKVEWIKKGVNLILQPMSRHHLLREYLYNNGFMIGEERAVAEGSCYTIINAFYDGYCLNSSDSANYCGGLKLSEGDSLEYYTRLRNSIARICEGKRNSNSDNQGDYEKYRALLGEIDCKMGSEHMCKVGDIYKALDRVAPFSTMEKWDNSGLLVGSREQKVESVLIALDITNDVVEEAHEMGAELIISHHPVIFELLKSVYADTPVYNLVKYGISAICSHTPLDMAKGGVNDVIAEKIGFEKIRETLQMVGGDNLGYGKICKADREYTAYELAQHLKEKLGCESVRYHDGGDKISTVAFCGGSGGGFLERAVEMGVDAFFTGDIKHDRFITARNLNYTLLDCGHFYTENIVCEYLLKLISVEFPEVNVKIAKSNVDSTKYI